MAYNQFVTLGASKLYVRLNTWRQPGQPASGRNTLSAKSYAVIGAHAKVWTFTALVQDVPASGYHSRSAVQALLDANTVSGRTLAFTDIWGASQGNVIIEGAPALVPELAPAMEGTDGWYSIDLSLRKVN
jgi:hypothetical protein